MTDRQPVPADLDAHEVAPGLWCGADPRDCYGRFLPLQQWFDAACFCSSASQPSAERFPGMDVLRVVNFFDGDDPIPPDALDRARTAAVLVADHLRHGRRVLVACHAGLNRSGFVCALALIVGGMAGAAAVAQVQARRWSREAGPTALAAPPHARALFNPRFVAYLRGCAPGCP